MKMLISILMVMLLATAAYAETPKVTATYDEFTGAIIWGCQADVAAMYGTEDVMTGLDIIVLPNAPPVLRLTLMCEHREWLFPKNVWVIVTDELGNETRLYLDVSMFGPWTVRYDTKVEDGGILTEMIIVVVALDGQAPWDDSMRTLAGAQEIRMRIEGEYFTEDVYADPDTYAAVAAKYRELTR